MSEVYIGLGSNLDQPLLQIQSALTHLSEHRDLTLNQVSSLYQSKPWGVSEQGDFINAVAKLETKLSPAELLHLLQVIEKKHNRVRTEKWGPRTLDLDILLFDQLELKSPKLTVPHLYLTEREFVVYPLAEIAPDLVLPSGETIAAIAARCQRRGLLKLEEDNNE